MAISDEDRREVARWAAGSAERALPLFEAVAPTDARPREAIEIARAFADGAGRSRHLTAVAMAAHRAGREVAIRWGWRRQGRPTWRRRAPTSTARPRSAPCVTSSGQRRIRPWRENWPRAARWRWPTKRFAGRSSTPRRRSAVSCGGSRRVRQGDARSTRSNTGSNARSANEPGRRAKGAVLYSDGFDPPPREQVGESTDVEPGAGAAPSADGGRTRSASRPGEGSGGSPRLPVGIGEERPKGSWRRRGAR